MAVSKREQGSPFRTDETGTVRCNTCGGSAASHLYRPAIGYRCESCVMVWTKIQTVSTKIIGQDAYTVRACEPGEAHVGVIDTIPATGVRG